MVDFLNFLNDLKNNGHEEEARYALISRCEEDLELFALTYFPHYCQDDFSEFHHSYFHDRVAPQRGRREVVIAPRGAAKSTTCTLIAPIHDLCYGREKYILIISNTEAQALTRVKNIRYELLENRELISDFGPFFETKRVADTKYVAKNNLGHTTAFHAIGTGTEIRGVSHREARPSKIIADDLEHSERVEKEVHRKKDSDYFFQVVSKLGDPKTNIEAVGTVLHPESLLQTLRQNPVYTSKFYQSVQSWSERQDLWDKWVEMFMNIEDTDRIVNAKLFFEQNQAEMLRGTKVLWPQREPYDYLMREMLEIGKHAFWKEKQNEPRGSEDTVFDRLHYYREEEDGFRLEDSGKLVPFKEMEEFCYGAIDPATGQTKPKAGAGPDFTAIGVGYFHPKGRLFVHHVFMKVVPPTRFIRETFDLHSRFNFQKFAIETNLYRNLLSNNFVRERKEREQEAKKKLHLPFYDVENTAPKLQRIYGLEPKISHGWIVFNRSLPVEYVKQFEYFPNADHDDGPDMTEMLWNLCRGAYTPSPVSISGVTRV